MTRRARDSAGGSDRGSDRSPARGSDRDSAALPRALSPAVKFAIIFIGGIIVFSVLLSLDAVNERLIVPFTGLIASASSLTLNLFGLATRVAGTQIEGAAGFSVNILNGCNGVYVTAILVSAVLAFPSTAKEKLLGLALGIPGIQLVNLIRIVSLYYIGLRRPDLFDSFHLYIWQTAVIILSMGLWIFWAEVLVGRKRAEPSR
jgi:exosortase H (IPTLxxWG-CTERM-specific)